MTTSTVLKVRPQGEKKATERLTRYGLTGEFWIERRIRRRRGRKTVTSHPLVPGYIITTSSDADIAHALSCMELEHHHRRDIVGIVGHVSDRELEAVRAVHDREVDSGATTSTRPRIGEVVTLRSGPFDGWNVTVRALHGAGFSAVCSGFPLRLPYAHLHPG